MKLPGSLSYLFFSKMTIWKYVKNHAEKINRMLRKIFRLFLVVHTEPDYKRTSKVGG